MSLCRQNYHEECEAGVNKHINLELYASYVYLAMASYFDQDDIALTGSAAYFRKNSDKEREQAALLIKFQNQRGGRVVYKNITSPEKSNWGSLLDAMKSGLDLEKHVNQSLLDLHALAGSHNDAQMCDFIDNHYLTEQVETIKERASHIANLKRCGNGVGEFLFDKDLK